jgi:hypothetical protein
MQWSEFTLKNAGAEAQVIQSFQYAGPLRIPPENFQVRVRKEVNPKDAVNSRYVEKWNASVPTQASPFYRSDITDGGVNNDPDVGPSAMSPSFMDMAPLSSRTDKRDFRQSVPFDPTGAKLSQNPFFDRYDPTRDPRNMVRELRSVVYELKEADRGLKESDKLRNRNFANRHTKEGETPTAITQAADLLRPKIDDPEVVYRGQKTLWSLGSEYAAPAPKS